MNRLAILFALVAALLGAAPARAADVDPAKARAEIERILATEEFATKRTDTFWKYIGDERDRGRQGDGSGLRWLRDIGNLIAALSEMLMWAAVAVGVFLLWRYRHLFLRTLPRREEDEEPLPEPVSGASLRPETLPADPAGEARRLAAAGRLREALSLLYRATLVRLAGEYALELPAGFTEAEALRAVTRAARPEHAGFFHTVVGLWQALAYAGIAPAAQR
ncbi:MAG TPA: hypothetical protein VLW45_01395, partial [Pelomicrobium sp.]|nr:hypothetical protein [Pelomicrobium sp.]